MITGQVTEGKLGLSYEGKDYGEGSISWIMNRDRIEKFAWWGSFNTWDPKHSRVNKILVDKEANLTALGRALTSGLDPEVADCDAAADERIVDFGNGQKVLQYNGGYYDICSKEYLGHIDAVKGREGMARSGAKKIDQFDFTLARVPANPDCAEFKATLDL
jgi:hypothetical protein